MTDTRGESRLVSMSTCLYNDVYLYKRSLEFKFGYIKRKADDFQSTDIAVRGGEKNLDKVIH